MNMNLFGTLIRYSPRLAFFAVSNNVVVLYVSCYSSKFKFILLTLTLQSTTCHDRRFRILHGNRCNMLLWASIYVTQSRYVSDSRSWTSIPNLNLTSIWQLLIRGVWAKLPGLWSKSGLATLISVLVKHPVSIHSLVRSLWRVLPRCQTLCSSLVSLFFAVSDLLTKYHVLVLISILSNTFARIDAVSLPFSWSISCYYVIILL